MKQFWQRTTFGKLDRYLCANHPVIWRTQIHWVLLISLILVLLSYGLSSSNLLRIEMGHIPSHNNLRQLVNWLQVGVSLSLVYWLYTQYRIKLMEASWRSFGLTLVLSAAVFGLVQLPPIALQLPIYQKLAESRPDALFEQDWALVESTGFLDYVESETNPDKDALIGPLEQLAMSYGFIDPSANVETFPIQEESEGFLYGDFRFGTHVYIYGRTEPGAASVLISTQLAHQIEAIYHGKQFQLGEGVYAHNQTFIWKEVLPLFLLVVLLVTYLGLAPSMRRPRGSWLIASTWWALGHRLNAKRFAQKDRTAARQKPERWRVPWHYVIRYLGLPILLCWVIIAGVIGVQGMDTLLTAGNVSAITDSLLLSGYFGCGFAALVGILLIWSRRPLGVHVRPRHTFWQIVGGSAAVGSIGILLLLGSFWQIFHVSTLQSSTTLDDADQLIQKYQWVYYTPAHSPYPADLDLTGDPYYPYYNEIDIQEYWGLRVLAYRSSQEGEQGSTVITDGFGQEDWQGIARSLGYDYAEVKMVPVSGDLEQAFINQASFEDYSWKEGMPWVKELMLPRIVNDKLGYQDPPLSLKDYLEKQIPDQVAEVRFGKKDKTYNIGALSHQIYLIADAQRGVANSRDWRSNLEKCLIIFLVLFGVAILAHHILFSFRMLGKLTSIRALAVVVLGGILFLLWGVITSGEAAFEIGVPLAFILILMTQIVIRADRKPVGSLTKLITAVSFVSIPIGCFMLAGYIANHFYAIFSHRDNDTLWVVAITGLAYLIFASITLKNLHWAHLMPKRK